MPRKVGGNRACGHVIWPGSEILREVGKGRNVQLYLSSLGTNLFGVTLSEGQKYDIIYQQTADMPVFCSLSYLPTKAVHSGSGHALESSRLVFINSLMYADFLNPSNAEATFVQSTRMQSFSKTL